MSSKSRTKYLAMAAMFLCSQLLPLQVLAGNGFYGYNVKPNVFIKQQFAPGFVKPQFNPGFVKPQFNPGFVKPQFNPGFVKPQFNPGFIKPNVFIQQQFVPGFAKPNAFIPKQFSPGGFGNAKANFGFGFKNVQGIKQWQGISPAVYSLGGAGKFAGQNFGAFAGFKNAQAFAGKSPVFGMIRPSKFNGANFPASFKTFNGGIPTNPFKALNGANFQSFKTFNGGIPTNPFKALNGANFQSFKTFNGAGFTNPLKTFNGVPNHHAEQWSFGSNSKPMFIGKAALQVGALVHPQFEFTGNGEFPAGFSLDLGSRNLVAVAKISAPMQILVGGYLDGNGNVSGGMPMVINPGQLLTPAQYAALDQIAETGHQSLVLTKHGVAATGFLTLEPADVSALGNLAVPRMVTVSGVGFTPEDPFVVNGGAFVVGNVFASQNTPNAASVMQLGSLAVGPHGMVSGAASTSPGLAGRVFSSASLALEVAGDVFNQGMITNPGILNIRAGGSITNQSVAGMPRATISGSEVNLFTGSGQLNNSGLIAATAGNLFINTAPTRDLIINNYGGAMEALNGAINFRTPAYNGTANINFNGGDLTARSFTFSSGKGTVDILANSLNGITNINACNAHLTTANNILNLGNMNLSGDPSFYNFGGPINVSGALNFAGQALALISSTNINFLAGSSISTANAAGAGGNVVIIAGANANPVPGNNPVLPPGAGDTTTTVTLSGPSATGGTIDMSGLGSFTSTGSTNGGGVTLAATAGSTVGSGRIIAPAGLTINTGGAGAGTNGAVNVFAGATTGTAITMGNVNTTGGTGGGGGINIQTATPNGLNGLTVLNGAITSGSITPGTVQAASVTTGTLTAPGATVAVTGGQNVQTGVVTNNGIGANQGGTVNLTASAASTNGTLTAAAISANGGATGNGGIVNLTNNSSGLLSVNGTINANGGTTSGNGGSITATNTGAAGANGGITVASAASLNANATLGGGGSATINAGGATPGALTFGGGGSVLSANAGGPAGGAILRNGGTVSVTGRTVAVTAGLQTLRANAASGGNGGSVSLTTLGNTGDITVGSGAAGLQFSATGGSAGSTSGNGGAINLSAGRNLTSPTAGVLTVTPLGNVGNGGQLNLTAGTAVTNGVMTVGALTANGAATGNGGTINLTNNSSGLLTVNGAVNASAGATSGSGGAITITNTGAGGANGGISVTNNLTANRRGGSTPGAITVNAGGATPGAVTIAGSFNANSVGAATANGGAVSVTGRSITINGNNRVFSANAAGAGNGGSVSFTSLGATGDITAAGTGLQFTATGGSAGSAAGNGGTVTLSAGRNLSIPAGSTINVNALGTTGNAGNVNLAASVTSTNGTLTAGAINANGGANGNGGNVTLTNNSAGLLTAAGAIGASAGATSGASGSITITNLGSGGANGGITVSNNLTATRRGSVGGTIAVNSGGGTPGAVTIAGSFNNSALGAATANGGSVTVTGRTITINGNNRVFSANAAGAGTGGSVQFTSLGAAGDISGTGTGMQFTATGGSAGSAAGNGGTVSLSAARTLGLPVSSTINVSALGTNGVGGNALLTASNVTTTGNLTAGAITANGAANGQGGVVSVTNNSTGLITLGGTINANGGATSGNGGTLTVTNTGAAGANGGVLIASAASLNANATQGSGGAVTINAGGATPGAITFGGGGAVVSANGGGAAGGAAIRNGGTISITGRSVAVTAGLQTFRANAASSGNGGTVSVTALGNTGDITVGSGATGLQFSATGGSAGSAGGNGGTISLSAGRNLTSPAAGVMNVNVLGNVGNGGTLNLTASTAVTNGTLTVGTLTANAAATGTGGIINLTSNSSSTIALNNTISVNGGTTAGNGGTLTVTNTGAGGTNGGISIASGVSQNANTTVGSGGSITLNAGGATPGNVTFGGGGGVVSANGGGPVGGAGVNSGGTVSVTGQNVILTAGSETFRANGASSGNGGTVSVSALGATGDITVGVGATGLLFSATGGSAGSNAGNGGTINITAGRNVTIPGAAVISTNPLGNNGTGGNISLVAGATAASGQLKVSQALSANGVGTGGGGNINISYRDTNPLIVGAAGANSFITGNITANAAGAAATGGTVTISNTAASALDVTLNGTISANASLAANLGNINFVPSSTAQAVSVVGPGNLFGKVNATAASVNINPQAAGTTLTAGQITSTSGAINLAVNGNASQVVVATGGNVTSSPTGTDVTISGQTVTSNGLVSSNRDLTINADNLAANGNMTTTRDLNIAAFTVGGPLVVTPAVGINLTAGRDVNFGLGNPGQITVTGGNISAGAGTGNVLFNGGNQNVNVNVNTIAGGVTGSANAFNVTVQNGNLLTRGIDVANTNPAATVSLTAQNGSLTISGDIGNSTTPVNTTSLTSFNDLQSGSITGTVFTNTLNLTSLNGNINGTSTATPFLTNAANVTANAAGSAFISNSASGIVSLGTSSAGTDFNFIATNASTLQTTGTIDAGNTNPNATVSLTAQTGSLFIGANIGNNVTPVGITSLTSFNDLQNASIAGTIFTNTLNLTSLGGNINGGSLVTPFSTSVANVSANAAGSVFISNSASGVVSLGTSSAGSDFNFIATNASTLQTTGTIDAGNTNPNATVSLSAQAGSLSIGANIGNNTTPVGTTSLTAFNDLQSASITGTIFTNALNLTSLNGNINGSSTATPFLTNAASVTANAAGSAFISNSASGVVSLGTSSAGTDFNFIATNASTLQTTGTIDAGNTNPAATITLTAQLGTLLIGANIGNSTTPIASTSLTSFNDLQSANITGTIFTNALNLTSLNGNINGSSTATPFLTNAATVTANAAGSAFISNSASGVVSLGTSSAGTDFNFIATNASTLQTTGTIDAGNTNPSATVSLTAQAGSLTIGANIGNNTTPVATTSLTSFNDLQSASITGTIFTNTLNLTSLNGNINGSSTATPFLTNAANVTANAAGSAFISDSASGVVSLGTSSAGSDFNFIATNASTLQTTGTIDAGNTNPNATVSLTAQLGSLAIGANIGNNVTPVGITSLTSFNDLQSASITGTIFTNTLNLTSLNGNINGSSTATPFLTNAANVTANAAGSAFISDSASGVVSLGTSSAGSDFNFIATNASTLQTTGTIDAGNTNPNATVSLTAQLGSLAIGANIGNNVTPVGITSLTSFNDLQSASITGTIFTNTLNLTSTNGNINGSSTATPFLANAANVSANAAGSVFISDSAIGTVTINNPSSAGGDFQFVTTNASLLQTTATIDAANTNPNATVSLISQAGSLTVGAQIGNNTVPLSSVTLNAGFVPGGNVVLGANVDSSGALTIASGNAGAVTINNGLTITGGTVSVTTPTLNQNGILVSNAGDLSVASNGAGNALAVNLGVGSAVASAGNMNFNTPGAPGSIQMIGGNGDLSAGGGAGAVAFNGGAGAVNVDVNSMLGSVVGTGNPFNIRVETGNLTAGGINGGGAVTLDAGATAGGSVNFSGNVTANGTLNIIAGTAGAVGVGAGQTQSGNGVNITAPTVNNSGAIVALSGNLNVASNGAGNALAVNLGTGAAFNAMAGDVIFNTTGAPGQITMFGQGDIVAANGANHLILNGGTGAVDVNIHSINAACIDVTGSSIAIQTTTGNLFFCQPLDTSSTTGSGGPVTVIANGGAVVLDNVNTNGVGAGNSAGTVTISSTNGVTVGQVTANGTGGAAGGVVNINAPNNPIHAVFIEATGSGSANGGSVNLASDTLTLSGQNGAGNSLDTSALGTGTGGPLTVTTTNGAAPFIVGGGAGVNGTNGNIVSNGFSGGFIKLNNFGGWIVNSGAMILANGGGGDGGKIRFQNSLPAGSKPLVATINGFVQADNAANTTGRVGFNGGPGQNITLLGNGVVWGGEFVSAGNLDPETLELISPAAGIIKIDPNLTILNRFITNGTIPPNPQPIPIPIPNPGSGSNSSVGPGATTVANLNAEVGTQISPLQGFVAFNQSSANAFLPSTTATDITQIFNYSNLDQTAPPQLLGIGDGEEEGAMIDGARTFAGTFESQEMARLSKEGIKLANNSGNNYLNLDKGNVFFHPDKSIVVGTHEGEVYIAANACVFVMESGNDVAVYDLHQSRPGQVTVISGKKKLTLEPGRMLVLTRQNTRDFEEVKGDFRRIGYRRSSELDIDQSVKAFAADFSIPSAVNMIRPIKTMLKSDQAQEQTAISRILKSSVILSDLTDAAGPFSNGDLGR